MKAIVTKRLNRRIGSPSVNASKLTPLEAGTTIEIAQTLEGDKINGNYTWYRAEEGWYVWSGGVETNLISETTTKRTKKKDSIVPQLVIQKAIELYCDEWLQRYNAIEVSVGRKYTQSIRQDINCITFHVESKTNNNSQQIPEFISFNYENQFYSLPTDIIQTDKASTDVYISGQPMITGINITPKYPGFSCGRINNQSTGTIGIKGYRKEENSIKYYLISCFHVLCSNELTNNTLVYSPSLDDEVVSPSKQDDLSNNIVVGHIKEGKLTNYFDAALAELVSPDILSHQIYDSNYAPSDTLDITNEHVSNNLKVKLVGRTSNEQYGNVVSHFSTVIIKYPRIGDFTLNGMIKTTKISKEGDSGAPVFDFFGKIIGLLVASDSYYSYVLPIGRILYEFNVELIKN